MSATTRFTDPTLPEPPALYLALELSNRSWKLAFSTGHGQKPRFRNVPARDLDTLTREIALARKRFDLSDSVPVISCYEAGRDGFWIHRFLQSQSHCFNLVVDSASHRGQPPPTAPQDRPHRRPQAPLDAHPLPQWRVACLVRRPCALARGRGRPPPSPRAPHPQVRPHSHHQPHQGSPRCPGPLGLFPQSRQGCGRTMCNDR